MYRSKNRSSTFISTNIVGIEAMKSTPKIKMMKEREEKVIRLLPEPSNPYDSNAVAVMWDAPAGAIKIGYLPNPPECGTCGKIFSGRAPSLCECGADNIIRDGIASEISKDFANGYRFYCTIENYLGMEEGKPSAGLRIKIMKIAPVDGPR